MVLQQNASESLDGKSTQDREDLLAMSLNLLGTSEATTPRVAAQATFPLSGPIYPTTFGMRNTTSSPAWSSFGQFIPTAVATTEPAAAAAPTAFPAERARTFSSNGEFFTAEEAARTIASMMPNAGSAGPALRNNPQLQEAFGSPSTSPPANQPFDFTPENLPSPHMAVAIFSRFIQLTQKLKSLMFPVLHSQTLLADPYASMPVANAVLGCSLHSSAFFLAARQGVLQALADRLTPLRPDIAVASYLTIHDLLLTGYDWSYYVKIATLTRLIALEIITWDRLARDGLAQTGTVPEGYKLLNGVERETVRRVLWAIYVIDKVLCHLAYLPPLVTCADLEQVALPVPEPVWLAPVIESNPAAEEARWKEAAQISGRELFDWKERPGLLEELLPSMTPLHYHILIADFSEWIDRIYVFNTDGGRTERNKERVQAALRGYYAMFVAPYVVSEPRAAAPPSSSLTMGCEDYILQAPPNNGLAASMLIFYKLVLFDWTVVGRIRLMFSLPGPSCSQQLLSSVHTFTDRDSGGRIQFLRMVSLARLHRRTPTCH